LEHSYFYLSRPSPSLPLVATTGMLSFRCGAEVAGGDIITYNTSLCGTKKLTSLTKQMVTPAPAKAYWGYRTKKKSLSSTR